MQRLLLSSLLLITMGLSADATKLHPLAAQTNFTQPLLADHVVELSIGVIGPHTVDLWIQTDKWSNVHRAVNSFTTTNLSYAVGYFTVHNPHNFTVLLNYHFQSEFIYEMVLIGLLVGMLMFVVTVMLYTI